jgi:hypothetical protein
MNIFYLDNDPKVCAQMHNNKHTIKMILEYSQLLSTAHRVLDGEEYFELTANGRRIKRWELSDDREEKLYKASHINHPSAIWCRKGIIQYRWLHNLLIELCKEYTYRYGKIHKVERDGLLWKLEQPPKNIHTDVFWSEPTPAMPDEVKIPGDSMASYHNYYINNKTHLASWRGKINSRNVPGWYNAQL